ncbi:hypothetical protein P691DRAFT_845370 [Macrolepiota fuliginosa MF-IS2]|uniref:RING-type domain-containing protein n=1 Tax=Macrolepiota fuliginosa MF-IS2 TaxID=1400762 RepID=A0A9P5XK33_9AGAR|nr:hypothetical protein P691DRAFT_845370 [Macrolepiota fuliginosa MF-IS2]
MEEKKLTITINKGKGRAREENPPSPTPVDRPPVKKPKRAETRPCPVCDEPIPLRLMARHAQLESERVEEIIKQIGSSEPILLSDEIEDLSRPGPSTGVRSRRSALKALKHFTLTPSDTTNEQLTKTIQTIQRRRKQRYARFKEMAREEEEGYSERSRWARRPGTSDKVICPVCSRGVRGDQEVLDAHVDACLADESRRLEEDRVRRAMQESVAEDEWSATETVLPDGAVGHVGNVRGTGFHTRDQTAQDVDDEIDIDGDDQETYGEAQFTEGDILPVDGIHPSEADEDVEVEIEGDQTDEVDLAQKTLRDLIAEGKVQRRFPIDEGASGNAGSIKGNANEVLGLDDADKADLAVFDAKKKGDKRALIAALEDKVKQLESVRVSSSTSLLCRICLDPYDEPTVSTGCWHTCCRECWLRCLGSTKLCPICKRITSATDLRRIYL